MLQLPLLLVVTAATLDPVEVAMAWGGRRRRARKHRQANSS